jgi:PAS domain S-box-containing protein
VALSPEPARHSFTLRVDLSETSRARRLVAQFAAEAGFPEERCFDIQVASSEACANAIEHSPPGSEVVLEVVIYQDRLEVKIEGPGQFELPAVAARERVHRGLGLPLMAKLSDHLALYSGPRGGTLAALTFYRPGFRDENEKDVTPPSIAALLEESELVAAITDAAPVGLFVLDPELRFRWVNPTYRQFLEDPYRSQRLEGIYIGDAVPGSEEMGSLDILRAVSRSGDPAFFPEYDFVGFARGTTYWRWETLPLERDRSAPPYDVLVVISEITEQVVQRQRLDALATEAADRAGQLQGVLDASAVAIWVAHDPECRVITGNLYADQVVMGGAAGGNISRSALPGAADISYAVWRDGCELNPSELPAQIAARTAQPVFDQEFELRFPDGRAVHMLANALPVFDADGRVRGSVTAAVDVTERKKAEEALREAEHTIRLAERASRAGTWDWDVLTGSIKWDGELFALFGLDPAKEQASFETWGRILHPEDKEEATSRIGSALRDHTTLASEYRIIRADATQRWIYAAGEGTYDLDGNPVRMIGICFDITARKQAEEAVKASEDRLSFALEVSATGAWDLDLADHTAHRSPEHDRIFGYESLLPEWTYEMFLDHVMPEDRAAVDEEFQAAVATRGDWSFECRIRRADGELRWIWAAGRHRSNRTGGRRMAGIVQDITERKRAETQLVRLNRILQALSASNQALVRATDESTYLDEACRLVVEDCGYAMVWIGYAEDGEAKCVRPVASAGFEQGYLDALNVTWADTERGRGPTGSAVRTGEPSLCRNMLTDPRFIPWRDQALSRGFASSISLPLVAAELPFGAITIYSTEPDPFSDGEVRLLADLARDVARGITILRLRAAEARAEEERKRLLRGEEELAIAARDIAQRRLAEEAASRANRYNRSLIEAAPDPLVTIGPDGKITDVNEATVAATGRGRSELIGTDFSDYFTDPEAARRGYREVFAKGSVKDYPLTIRDREGKLTDVLYNASVYRDDEGSVLGVFAAARDITALRLLDEQRAMVSLLQQAFLDMPQHVSGVTFGHLYRSATHQAQVGGDFYDVFEAKGGRIGLLIGDVSGHGLEAARIATLVKDVIHAFAYRFHRPHLVLRETNRLLVEKNLPGFVTAFLGFLDPASGALTYSSAGHPPPLLSAEGQVERLKSIGLPLGAFADARYHDAEEEIREGSVLLFYTDGITEARREGELYGEARLSEAFGRNRHRPIDELPSLLLSEALDFSGGTLRDDVALLAVNYLGKTPNQLTALGAPAVLTV